jgi:hypothetical protein
MPESFTIERVQALRRLTRAVADVLREQVNTYLSTLSILLRPRRVLGNYIEGAEKEIVKGADRAFKDLQGLYQTVSRAKPFTLNRELGNPLPITNVSLEIHPVEYIHEMRANGVSRTVSVRSPLAWTLSYADQPPAALADLLSPRAGANDELHAWLVHQLVLYTVAANQPGLQLILERLHFPLSFVKEPASGQLPVTRISSPLSTQRPPDDVIMQSVELSGMDAFEEVINVGDIERMHDPLKNTLIEIARSHGELGRR